MNNTFTLNNGAVGPITPSMSRSEVRAILGDCEEFKKTPFSVNTTDDFLGKNIHVYYDHDEHVVGIEFFVGARLIFKGLDLFDLDLQELIDSLQLLKVDYVSSSYGLDIPSEGIRVYAPADKSSVPKVESVYVEL